MEGNICLYQHILKWTEEHNRFIEASSLPAEWHSLLWPSKYEKGITVSGLCRLVSSVSFITFNFIFGPLELSFEIHFFASWYVELKFYFLLCLLYPLNTSCSLHQILFQLSFLHILWHLHVFINNNNVSC